MEYKSTIKSRPYLYKETKKASSLVNEGLDVDYIKEKSLQDNIFQLESEARKKEVASIITARLKDLDKQIIYSIENSNVETSKVLVLYAILKTDRLFFEFINEVYKEKILLKDLFIKDKDFNLFFLKSGSTILGNISSNLWYISFTTLTTYHLLINYSKYCI